MVFFDLILIHLIVLCYSELKKLRLEHKVLYQLLQMLAFDLLQYQRLKQIFYQVNVGLISQAISDISTSFVPLFSVCPVIFSLNMYEILLLLLAGKS